MSLTYIGDPSVHSGLIVVAQLLDYSGTSIASNILCVEQNTSSIYTGNPANPSGDELTLVELPPEGNYVLRFHSVDSYLEPTQSEFLDQFYILWSGSEQVVMSGDATEANQAAILAKLTNANIKPIGSPLQGGCLRLVKNKDYLASNSNTINVPLNSITGLQDADKVLLTTRHKKTKAKEIDRVEAIDIDAVNETATFEITGLQLNYEFGAYYEYMIELKHGANYQAPIIGDHVLIDDLAE